LLVDIRKRNPQFPLVTPDPGRDTPLRPPEGRSLAGGHGLARRDAPSGTFIMYSAGVGETALDRLPGDDPDKVNSLYTRKLLPLVKTPGLPLHELARQLRLEVHDLAAAVPHVQQPAYYDGLIGKFCLAGCTKLSGASMPKSASSLPTQTAPAATTQRPTVPKPGAQVETPISGVQVETTIAIPTGVEQLLCEKPQHPDAPIFT